MRAPTRISDLQTRAEGINFLRSAFEKQLDASIDANTPPNHGIVGDYNTRQAFNVLLSPAEQRTFFQHIISDKRYWPRIKTLIGNPPFSFLVPEDESLLRAGGICRNRSNLSAKESSISKVSDFGEGHFRDDAERTYRVINHDTQNAGLPWQNISTQTQLIVDVCLKRYSQKTKVAIFRGTHSTSSQASLMFPRPNDVVVLSLSKSLQRTGAYSITVRINSGHQKLKYSPIARLVVTVLRA